MSTVYERRIEQEYRLLRLLAESNPGLLEVDETGTDSSRQFLRCTLRCTQALVEQTSGLCLCETHIFTLHFPRFSPSVPLEACLARPVFHPNVHPDNGFVCLWDRFSPGDTVIEATTRLQQVISWHLLNERSDHLLQPQAGDWYRAPSRSIHLPLEFRALRKPERFELARTYAQRPEGRRKRLS